MKFKKEKTPYEHEAQNELKSCPFCHSDKVKLIGKRTLIGYNGLDMNVYNLKVSVRCNKCHARGPIASGKIIPALDSDELDYTSSVITDTETLRKEATEGWNNVAITLKALQGENKKLHDALISTEIDRDKAVDCLNEIALMHRLYSQSWIDDTLDKWRNKRKEV